MQGSYGRNGMKVPWKESGMGRGSLVLTPVKGDGTGEVDSGVERESVHRAVPGEVPAG